jgi:hypothetical protein
VPWGFGKWWLGRARLLASTIATGAPGELFLGDNGGRWRRARRPRLFGRAEARRLAVLPGSDPLPFPAQVQRAGGYGFRLFGALDLEQPWVWLRARLLEHGFCPEPYGTRTPLHRFLRHQLLMQVRRRARRGAAA